MNGSALKKIPVTPISQMAKKDYDVLIIGTGAGGGAALWRLCKKWRKNKKRIGVIEAGDLVLPTHARNITGLNHKKLFNKLKSVIGDDLPHYSGATQALAVGGKTLFWGGVTPRLHPIEYKEWPIPMKDIENYYKIAERVMNVTQSYTKDPIMKTILHSLKDNGYPEATVVPKAIEINRKNLGILHSSDLFSSLSFLTSALNHRSFDLGINARATQIFPEKKRFIIKVAPKHNNIYFLKAKTVILSTGSLETPRLLLHSGVKGDTIGHYLVNHSSVRVKRALKIPDYLRRAGRVDILIPQSNSRLFQIQIHGKQKGLFLTGYGKVESRFENQLTLNSDDVDEDGVPKLQIDFSYSEKDQQIIREMETFVEQISSVIGLQRNRRNNDSLLSLRPPGADNHECGTCRMGIDPSTSATNSYGQIHSIPGLYIADNSVLPAIGAVNPTLTTISLAIRTVDYIVEHSK
ncbi:GMC family oxidoreductase [Oceanobacillus arenosus]|uniref:GMC family oxidoreductase n=1 Tax=Oceanobacillus arenosus TaxID=1229153 RepID=A0A3D8PME2_9BACI|nr:GMC oxidoreductase [Oceanobacillus arenosus]RDW16401.1 GMC family oxidoreductase [Oceanobacillus arenosus]